MGVRLPDYEHAMEAEMMKFRNAVVRLDIDEKNGRWMVTLDTADLYVDEEAGEHEYRNNGLTPRIYDFDSKPQFMFQGAEFDFSCYPAKPVSF